MHAKFIPSSPYMVQPGVLLAERGNLATFRLSLLNNVLLWQYGYLDIAWCDLMVAWLAPVWLLHLVI